VQAVQEEVQARTNETILAEEVFQDDAERVEQDKQKQELVWTL